MPGKVNGSLVGDIRKYLVEHHGPEAFDRVVGMLDEEDQNELRRLLTSMSWITEKSYANLAAAIDQAYGRGDFSLCRWIGSYQAKVSIPLFYKVFIRFGNPGFVLKRSSSLWSRMHDTGKMELVISDRNNATVRLSDKDYPHKAHCALVMGYCQAVMELSGARSVAVTETRCCCDGAPYCEYRGTWT